MKFKVDDKVVDIVPDSDASRMYYPSGYEELELQGDEETGSWYGGSQIRGAGWTSERAFQGGVFSGYYYTTEIRWEGSVPMVLGQCFIGVCRNDRVSDVWMILIKTVDVSDTYLMRLINANGVDARDLDFAEFQGRVVHLSYDAVSCVHDPSKFPMYRVNLKENGSEAGPISVLARGDGKALGATEHYELYSVSVARNFERKYEDVVWISSTEPRDLNLGDFNLTVDTTVAKGGVVNLWSPYSDDYANFSVIIVDSECVLLKVFPGIYQLITPDSERVLTSSTKVEYVYYAPGDNPPRNINVLTKPNS